MSDPVAREYRPLPSINSLSGKRIPVLDVPKLRRKWMRIVSDIHSTTFYASPSCRFTPASSETPPKRNFPCGYFAESATTCFAELYGDSLAKHHATSPGVPFSIPATQAAARGIYEIVEAPPLRLCDFGDETTLLRLGLDLTTVYSLDLKLTQHWAVLISNLPENYDGIRFRSRHTSKLCQVLWNRPSDPSPLSSRMKFARTGTLLNAPFAWEVAATIGSKLSFPEDFGL
jgi:hypothetical protein